MMLSDRDIRRKMSEGLLIKPFNEDSLQPASYDLRAGESTVIQPKAFALVGSLERVEMPLDVASILKVRSSYARKGLILGGGFIDPGFRGNLTLCLSNMSDKEIEISYGERIVQMLLFRVTSPNSMYKGKYQDSNGVVKAKL
ncbi:MAG: dCTP deaminase [Methanosarcinales archaeon Met12]|nr:MAG: dCTP deaminase [Methanosarcinales archaeon Met12]